MLKKWLIPSGDPADFANIQKLFHCNESICINLHSSLAILIHSLYINLDSSQPLTSDQGKFSLCNILATWDKNRMLNLIAILLWKFWSDISSMRRAKILLRLILLKIDNEKFIKEFQIQEVFTLISTFRQYFQKENFENFSILQILNFFIYSRLFR